MDIDDQPIRVRQQECRVLCNLMHIQHDARNVIGKLRGPNAGQEPVVGNGKTLACQFRRKMRVVQIEEDAVRVLYPRCLVLDLITKVDRNTRVA